MTHTITAARDLAEVLREVRIFCASSGDNTSLYPSHVYGSRVIDTEGKEVWSSIEDMKAHEEGTVNVGFHKCLLRWLPVFYAKILEGVAASVARGDGTPEDIPAEVEAPRKLIIVAPDGDRIFDAYRVPVGELVARGFTKPDGKQYANAAWAAHVLAEAEAMGFSIECRPPADVPERALLELTQNELKRHRRAVLRAERNEQ